MASRPSAVAFDVVETLMPLEPLAARFERAGPARISAAGVVHAAAAVWGGAVGGGRLRAIS
jgi:hypothetical protein